MRAAQQAIHDGRAVVLSPRASGRVGGVGLVELMIALVLGLLVTGAVIALVLAMMKSDRQTIQATRLTQELRATLAVIANDLRRARSVDDPLSVAVAPGGNPYKAVSTATAGCAMYAYDGALDGPWHVIRLLNGTIVVQGAAARPADCSGGGTPVQLGSDQIEVTALRFSPTTTAGTPPQATDESLVREVTVTITGHLIDADPALAATTRTMSQTVFVRSVGTGI